MISIKMLPLFSKEERADRFFSKQLELQNRGSPDAQRCQCRSDGGDGGFEFVRHVVEQGAAQFIGLFDEVGALEGFAEMLFFEGEGDLGGAGVEQFAFGE